MEYPAKKNGKEWGEDGHMNRHKYINNYKRPPFVEKTFLGKRFKIKDPQTSREANFDFEITHIYDSEGVGLYCINDSNESVQVSFSDLKTMYEPI